MNTSLDCKNFQRFCIERGDKFATDALEKISDIIYSGHKIPGINIYSKDNLDINGLNCKVSGDITIGSDVFSFIIQDGNWNGTVVEAWDFEINWLNYLKRRVNKLLEK